jgi:type IV pilus modification protein PilV
MTFSFLKSLSRDNDSGFTLLEAMIAIFIFTIGILATVSMQTTSLNANMSARETTEAASAGASLIENLRPLSYAEDAGLMDGAHARPNDAQYAITYNVQRNTIIDNTMLIQVTINWTERGRPKSVNLTYIKADII